MLWNNFSSSSLLFNPVTITEIFGASNPSLTTSSELFIHLCDVFDSVQIVIFAHLFPRGLVVYIVNSFRLFIPCMWFLALILRWNTIAFSLRCMKNLLTCSSCRISHAYTQAHASQGTMDLYQTDTNGLLVHILRTFLRMIERLSTIQICSEG
jgi:hypothetical protein